MRFKGWEKIAIKAPSGDIEGIAPIIISASRSTDIPAFHAEWFMNRLEVGYVKWVNPFNQKPQYISFDKARVVVFWTKNPGPIIKHIPELDAKNLNYYFTFTLNDYEEEMLEPRVPELAERLETFIKLSELIGKEKVIWRFDPLILSDEISIDKLLNKIYKVGEKLHKYTEKLVISFVDINNYTKVARNLSCERLNYAELTRSHIEEIANGIGSMGKAWNIEVATCAEDMDLNRYSIKQNKCVDDVLMIRLFRHDKRLMDFLGYKEKEISLFEPTISEDVSSLDLKDKGQRQSCGCIVSKDIGQYNTCMHLCKYCYANTSANLVIRNCTRDRNAFHESILCR